MSYHEQPIYSLYIHWPFCTSKCYYCDFVAFEQHGDFQERYHRALINEIITFAKRFSNKQKITTIFIGGGTPSLYPLQEYEELFDILKTYFDLDGIQEISMEANPADITEEHLDAWESFGINRLSLGVQVLDDDVLFRLNRRQRILDVTRAAQLIPKYFDNFSFDFIIGLPGVSETTWKHTIKQALLWPLKHVSVYFLTVHEKTPLYFKVSSGKVTLPQEEDIVQMFEWTIAILHDAGFEHYEISNFAQPGYASIHNKGYWDYKLYKGFGVGACSFDGNRRFTNEKNLTRYLQKIENNAFNELESIELLTVQQKKMELWMLGLRQKKGIPIQKMTCQLNDDEKIKFFNNVEMLKSLDFLRDYDNTLSLTTKGMILENEVLLKLL